MNNKPANGKALITAMTWFEWRSLRAPMQCLLVLILCLFASTGYAAPQTVPQRIVWDSVELPNCIFEISGYINQNTITYVKEQYKLKERYAASHRGQISSCMFGRPAVWLDSPGGDVESAIAIGRFLRAEKLATIVPAGKRCASSCVIALLGGVERQVLGRVGIHRPYATSLSASVQYSQAAYAKINGLLVNYFDEMNIPHELLEAMNGVPPDQVEWLTSQQLEALHISGADPAWQDYEDSNLAQSLGITKAMLYERRNLAKRLCIQENDPTQHTLCEWKVVQHGER